MRRTEKPSGRDEHNIDRTRQGRHRRTAELAGAGEKSVAQGKHGGATPGFPA
jgi:hypothetical protein